MKNGVNGDIQSENGKEIRQRSRLKAYTNSKSMLLIDSGAYFTFSVGPLRRSEFFLPILTRAQDKCSGDDPPRVPRRSSCGKKTSLFGPLGGVGGRSGPAVPQGAAPGNEGGGRREGGVPRGGAQRWEEPPPPPRPPAPLRSAPADGAGAGGGAARSRRPLPGAGRPGCTMAGQEWDWFQREELIGHISDIRVQNLQGKQTPPRPLPRRPALLPPRLRFAPRLSSCSGIRSPPHGRREGEGGRRFPAAGVRGPAWWRGAARGGSKGCGRARPHRTWGAVEERTPRSGCPRCRAGGAGFALPRR